MRNILKYMQGVQDGIEREAVIRGLFQLFTHQIVAPATLAIKTASSALAKTSSAVFALVQGVPVKIAANTDMAALTGVTVANSSKTVVGWCCDVAGNISLMWNGATSTTVGGLTFPVPPDNQIVLGYAIIENGTGSTFTGGTTALDTASLTVTYVNQVDGIWPLTQL